jgi:hypothetical protein
MNIDGLSAHHRSEALKEMDVIAEKIEELKKACDRGDAITNTPEAYAPRNEEIEGA